MNKKNVIEQYKEIAKTYSFEDCYKLMIETKLVEECEFCLDSDGIWKRLELQWMLDFFQTNEDYEKCEVLKKIMEESYIADESKQNELNSKLNEYISYINNGAK